MSRTLLSQRLKELESAGIIERRLVRGEQGIHEYRLTQAGRDLRPVVEAFGLWGQKWIESQPSLRNLDPSLLMWDIRRNLDPTPLPKARVVVEFSYPELPVSRRHWWLVVEPEGDVDLCSTNPGFEVDLYVTTDLRIMTAIWMGLTTVAEAGDTMHLDGHPAVAATMQRWLGLSPFAVQQKLVS